jgi:hypothetical protein
MKTALVCIAKNEDNYIEEWIDYNTKLGFDHIFVYANDWEYKTNRDNVTVINMPGAIQQVKAYNHFKKVLSNLFNWAAFFDVDEFLVLNKHKNLKEFLSDYSDCNAIGINWAIFGNNGHETINGEYGIIKRFTKRANENYLIKQHNIIVNSHIKTIVQLPCSHFQDVHNIHGNWFNLNKEVKNGPFNTPIDWTVAQLNHYITKSTEEFKLKCERGRADTIAEKRNFEDHIEYLNANNTEDLKALDFFTKKRA